MMKAIVDKIPMGRELSKEFSNIALSNKNSEALLLPSPNKLG